MNYEEAFDNIVASLPDDFQDAGEIALIYDACEKAARESEDGQSGRVWKCNKSNPLSKAHGGITVLIRLQDEFQGISHSDLASGEDYTVDLSWMRDKGGNAVATTGTFSDEDIHSWVEIPSSTNPACNPSQPDSEQGYTGPVAYADPHAFINFRNGVAIKEWMWAKPDSGLQPVFIQNSEQGGDQPEGDGWVRCSDRLPTEADTDDDGKIWVYSEESDREQKVFLLTPETLIIHYRAGNNVPVTHWHHIPKRPQPPQQGGAE